MKTNTNTNTNTNTKQIQIQIQINLFQPPVHSIPNCTPLPYSSVQFTLHPADPRHGATYHETKAKGGDGSPRKSQQQQVIQAVQIVK